MIWLGRFNLSHQNKERGYPFNRDPYERMINVIDINDDNCFYRSSICDSIYNGFPRIGMEDDNFLLFRAFSIMGDNDNEYHQKEFIHVDLTDDYTTLAVRLSIFRIFVSKNDEVTDVSNHYDFTCDIDSENDGPVGIQNKLTGLFIKTYKKTHNRVKDEDISFISTVLIGHLTKFKLMNHNDEEKKKCLTKEEVEDLINKKLSELNKRLK